MKVRRSSAFWNVSLRRSTETVLSRYCESKSTLTPASRPIVSRIFCRLVFSNLIEMGALLCGESTGSGPGAAWARAFTVSNSDRRRLLEVALRMRSCTMARSSAADLLAGS